MLRAKQLGTLSQCARSFYISGSRCTTDGASCGCSEDDTSVSRRQKNPTLASGIASKSATNAVVPATKSDSYTTSGNSNSLKDDVPAPQKGGNMTAERLVKTGMGAVSVISELVNHKIATDVNGLEKLPNDSHEKPRNRAKHSKVKPNSSVNIVGDSNTAGIDCGDRAGRTKQSFPAPCATAQRSPENARDKRQPVQRRGNYHVFPDVKPNPGRNMGYGVFENANKSQRALSTSVNSVRAVEQYYHTIQQLRWGPATEKALSNLHCKLNPFQANQVLKLLHDHSVAFGFFEWLKRQAGFKHDDHTYTTMIGILGQSRQFVAMERLLEEMGRPTVVTFNRMIHAYGRANFLGEAVGVFRRMQAAGQKPDRVTYCTMIDIHAKAGYLEAALELYRRMQEVGLSLDTFTYSAMVNCLGKGGYLEAAYKLFCEMVEKGCIPNLVTYNIMIALQAKARNYPSAVRIYREMRSAGFRPDKITYSIVMEVLGHSGRLDEVEAVFAEMNRDWIPDEPAYGLLVDLWGKSGDVDRAQWWYQSMIGAGLLPNVPTCNSLLSAFLKAQRFSEAYDFLLTAMLGSGLAPSLQTYTLLLSCCVGAEMGRCCKLMAITGHPAHTFLMSLPDSDPSGRNVREHAGGFLDLMRSEDRESKRGLVDAVVDFLRRSGLKEEAGMVWEAAAERNVYPGSVREKREKHWLINLHVMSEGTAVTALSRTLAWLRAETARRSGTGPRRIDIVTGWGRRSRVTGASLVRRSVEELLSSFGFPFAAEEGNSGCFVGCGDTLNTWLMNSYVERMHLL